MESKLRTHFKNIEYQNEYMDLYNQALAEWRLDYSEHVVPSVFGSTYVIEWH